MTNAEAIEQLTDIRNQMDRDVMKLGFQRMKQTMRATLTAFCRKEQAAIDIAIAALKAGKTNDLDVGKPLTLADPRNYRIKQDRDGFFIVDDQGKRVEKEFRYPTEASARLTLEEFIDDFMKYYEPPELEE